MKILYTLNSGQPGGMEYHTLDLAKGMIKKGHEVHIWCCVGVLGDLFKDTGAKVTISIIKSDLDIAYINKLRLYLKDNNIDVVHTHELKAVINTLIASKLANTKVRISHTHTAISQWPIPNFKKKIYIFMYSKMVNLFASKEIALTQEVKKIKISEGIKEAKLKIISNGFDESKFVYEPNNKKLYRQEMCDKYNIPINKFIFGNLSRLSENKGTDILLFAYKNILDNHSTVTWENSHLLLAGKSEMHLQVQNLVEELGLQNNVTITGTFPDSDHLKLYNTLDAFVFPSLSEGFGLVLIEAMALNIPVISSDLPVLREVAKNHTYGYFSTSDIDSVTSMMLKVHDNYEDALEIADKARRFVNSVYTLDNFVTNYENLYLEILE